MSSFQSLLVKEHRGYYRGARQVHIDGGAVTQHITFRLHNSIPKPRLKEMQEEHDELEPIRIYGPRVRHLESKLNENNQQPWLMHPEIAEIVQDTLTHWHTLRY